ncbi:MAG: T9SS type A sorting domain-containing protein [Bacteroidales bacterium]|nr:T9SS type A sorting domain-containing protein [Bacteroidales bacterium]
MKKLFTLSFILLICFAAYAKPQLPAKPAARKAEDFRFITKIKQNHLSGIEKIKEFRNSFRLLGQYEHYWSGENYDTAARYDYIYNDTYSTDYFQKITSIFIGDGFALSTRETFFKDEASRDTLVLWQYSDFDTGNWVDYYRSKMRYDSHGNQILDLFEFWDEVASSWITTWGSKMDYVYDANGNMLSMSLTEYYGDDIWIPWLRVLYEYDSNNLNTSLIDQFWDDNEDKWVNDWREDYEYTGGGWSQVHYSFWDEDTEIWMLSGRAIDITWLNFEEFKWLTVRLQEYQGKNWVNAERGTATYNAHTNPTSTLWEVWESNDWIPYYRDSIVYDEFQNILLEKYEFWNGVEWIIEYGERFSYTYDSQNNMIAYTIDSWDWETNDWMKVLKMDQWFETLTSTSDPLTSQISMYPNPAKDFITIEHKMPSSTSVANIFIVDITGRMLLNLPFKPDATIQRVDISTLTPGVYILYLHSSNEIFSKKIIKK